MGDGRVEGQGATADLASGTSSSHRAQHKVEPQTYVLVSPSGPQNAWATQPPDFCSGHSLCQKLLVLPLPPKSSCLSSGPPPSKDPISSREHPGFHFQRGAPDPAGPCLSPHSGRALHHQAGHSGRHRPGLIPSWHCSWVPRVTCHRAWGSAFVVSSKGAPTAS